MTERHRRAEVLEAPIMEHARDIVEWVRAQTFSGLVSAIYERYPQYSVNSVFTG